MPFAQAIPPAAMQAKVLTDEGEGGFQCAYNSGIGETQCTSEGTLTANVWGGSSNYSYAWSKLSGAGTIVGDTNGPSLSVTRTAGQSSLAGTYRVVVTDLGTLEQVTIDTVVHFDHIDTWE